MDGPDRRVLRIVDPRSQTASSSPCQRRLSACVTSDGAAELGRISAMVGNVESLTTPLLRQMDAFARRLTIVILAVASWRLAGGSARLPFSTHAFACSNLSWLRDRWNNQSQPP